MDTKKTGVAAILSASLMWSLEPVFAKLAYGNSDFLQTSAIRAVVVALTAAAYVTLTNGFSFRVCNSQIPKLVYIGIVGTVTADLLYFFALTRIPVINAVLIGHMQPVFIILIGFFLLREDRLTWHDFIGVSIMMAGGFLVTTADLANLSNMKLGTTGDLLVLFSTVAWATTAIVARKYLKGLHAGLLTFYRYAVASIALVAYLSLTTPMVLSNPYQIVVGVVVGVGTILYYEGLKRLKAAQVSALELSTPFFASIFGFYFLGEVVTIMQILGICLLVPGLHYLSVRENQ